MKLKLLFEWKFVVGRIAQLALHKLRLHELFACPREVQINGAWPYFRFRKNRNFRKEQTAIRVRESAQRKHRISPETSILIAPFFFSPPFSIFSLSRVFLFFFFPLSSLNHRLSSITLHFGWKKKKKGEKGLLRASVGKLRSIRLGNKELQAASRAARHKDIRLFRKCGSSGHTGELVPSSPRRSSSKISGRNAF